MIRIMAAGKVKDGNLAPLIDAFVKRCRPMARVEVVEVKDSNPDREARDMEARLGSAAGSQYVVALDERGDDLTSVQLSRLLGRHGNICFLIGGADGLGEGLRKRADLTLRLSSLTLTHEMARLLLTEQIYRGLSILAGKPYHRA